MDFWTFANLERVTGGRWLRAPADAHGTVAGLSTDTRALRPGQAFLALRGEKFDAHNFLATAAAAAAGVLVVSDEAKAEKAIVDFRFQILDLPATPSAPGSTATNPQSEICDLKSAMLLVPDTLAALHQLAAAYRDELRAGGCQVIAVGGSNGKTTTRNLIYTVLAAHFRGPGRGQVQGRGRGTQSPKSFNNHIGVPLTLLAAAPGDAFVVVEVGTNHPGELAALGALVRPDAAVITSIGHEHMEFFRTLDGVAEEEAQLLRFLAPEGVAVIEDRALARFERQGLVPAALGGRIVAYPAENESVVVAGEDGQLHQQFTDARGLTLRLPLLGRHNAANALAAVAVGRWAGAGDATIAAALAEARPVDMRLNIVRLGMPDRPLVLINDAYNANPDSVAAALRVLAEYPLPGAAAGAGAGAAMAVAADAPAVRAPRRSRPRNGLREEGREEGIGRRIAVLGDMRELGDAGPDLHRHVGRALAEFGEAIHLAILIGKLSLYTAEALARLWPAERIVACGEWSDALPALVAARVRPGDVVLLKASRSMGLERLVPALEQAAQATETASAPPAASAPAKSEIRNQKP